MMVEVFWGDDLIGRAQLDHLDPPMGVAFGVFTPTASYRRGQHAGPGSSIMVRAAEDQMIQCQAATVEDRAGRLELEMLGIPQPDYARFFGAHPDYQAYYR